MDQQFPATITGEEESHYKVDVHSGILLQGHSVFSIKGQLSVMGKDVPIVFKSEKSIEGKKS
jgi:hypothetical protein